MRQAFKGCVGKGYRVCGGGGRFDGPAGLMLDSSALTLRDIFQWVWIAVDPARTARASTGSGRAPRYIERSLPTVALTVPLTHQTYPHGPHRNKRMDATNLDDRVNWVVACRYNP